MEKLKDLDKFIGLSTTADENLLFTLRLMNLYRIADRFQELLESERECDALQIELDEYACEIDNLRAELEALKK